MACLGVQLNDEKDVGKVVLADLRSQSWEDVLKSPKAGQPTNKQKALPRFMS